MPTVLLLMVALVNAQASSWSPARLTVVRTADRTSTPLPALGVPTTGLSADVRKAIEAARPKCMIRVLEADPSIDRGIEFALREPVDPEMVREGECSE
jgi:hypothetical protein